MLMQLGMFQFELNTALYNELKRSTEYRWSSKNRHGNTPARQFLGAGVDVITLTGTVYGAFKGGFNQIDTMRTMASKGLAQLMIAGDGSIFGFYTIDNIDETQEYITKHGVASKQSFTMGLSFYGDRP